MRMLYCNLWIILRKYGKLFSRNFEFDCKKYNVFLAVSIVEIVPECVDSDSDLFEFPILSQNILDFSS